MLLALRLLKVNVQLQSYVNCVQAKEKLSKASNQSEDYRHLLADAERRSSSLQVRRSRCQCRVAKTIAQTLLLVCFQDMVNELTARNIDMKLFGEENMIAENGDVNER